MQDFEKTKEQLIDELAGLRSRVALLEARDKESAEGEQSLWGSGEKLSAVFQFIYEAIVVANLEYRVVEVNDVMVNVSGYSKGDIVGQEIFKFFAEEERSRAKQCFQDVLANGGKGSSRFEFTLVNARGLRIPVEIRVSAIRNNSENPSGFIVVMRDVTEQKQVENKLKEQHDELQLILDSVPALIYYKDKEGKLIKMNKATASLASVPKEKLLHKAMSQLMPDTADRYNKDDMEVITSGKSKMNIEEPLELPGMKRWLKTDKLPIKDENGNVIGIIGFSVDITERKMAEEALRHSEGKLRVMFETMTEGVVVTDLSGIIIDANKAALKITGYSKEEVIGRNGLDGIVVEERERAVEDIARSAAGTEIAGMPEFDILTKDGERRSIELTVDKLSEVTGKLYGFITVMRDVTEKKIVEEALKESERRYVSIFNNPLNMLFVHDEKGVFIDANEAALRRLGYTRSDLGHMSYQKVAHPDDISKAVKALANVVEKGFMDERVELRLMSRSGEMIWVEVYEFPIELGEGKYRGMGIAVDITERKRAQDELRDSEEKLHVIFDSMSDAATVVDMHGNIIDCNEAAVRLHGFSNKNEFIGRKALELVAVANRDRAVKDGIRSLKEPYVSGKSEYKLLAKDGREFDGEFGVAVIRDKSGKPDGFIGLAHDISGRKRAEEAVQRSEEKYRNLVEKERDVIFSVDALGFITSINPAVKGWGYTVQEILGKNFIELIPEDWKEKTAIQLQSALLASGELTAETRVVHKSGKVIPIEYSAIVIRDEGKYAGVQGIVRDMSERKKVEEALRQSEEKLRVLFEALPDGMSVIDLADGRIVDANPVALRMFGYSREEAIGRNAYDLIAPVDRERAIADLPNTLKMGIGEMAEWRLLNKKGETVDCEATVAVIRDSAGIPVLLVDVIRDVTERKRIDNELAEYRNSLEKVVQERTSDLVGTNKELQREISERQRFEAELRSSEEKHRALVDDMREGYLVIGDNKILFANKRCAEVLELAPDDLIGKDFWEFVASKDQVQSKQISEAMESRDVLSKLWSFVHPVEGGKRNILLEASIRPVTYEGKPAFAVVLRDITERNRIEEALKTSEEKLRGIFNSIQDGVVVTDLDFNITEANEAAVRMSGYGSKEKLVGHSGFDLIAPEELVKVMPTSDEAVKGHPIPRGEYRVINALGEEMYAEVGVTMYYDASGNKAGFVAVIKDITEHKRMEDALRDSEEKLRIMFTSMADGVVVTDMQGRITELNEAQLHMFGYKERLEVIGTVGFDFIVERDRERAVREIIKVYEAGSNIGAEYTVADKAGKEFEAELSTALLHDAEGKPTGLITVMRDITTRRRMEQAIRDSEEKLRIIFEAIGDGIIVTDLEGIVIDCNGTAARLGGWDNKTQLFGMSGFDFVAEKDRPRMVADFVRAIQERRNITLEYTITGRDGQEYECELIVSLLRDISGIPVGIVSVIRDMTERKRMEQALRDSEEMSRGMLESAATAVCIEQNGKFQYVSPLFAEMTGYSIDELIGTVSASYIYEADRDKATREAIANLKGESNLPHEYRLLRKDGSPMWMLEKVASIQYKGERAAIGNLLDITRLKQVEEALRDSEEKLRLIFASLPDGVTVTDMNGTIIEDNDAGIKLSGFTSKDQLIGLNGFNFIAKSDRDRALADLPKILETGVSGPLEYRMVSVDGREYDGELIAAMMRDKSGNPQGFITVIRDITERKKAREELRESQEMMRGMLESAATGIYLVQDRKFEYVSPMFAEISGYTFDELLGNNTLDYVHPDDREMARTKAVDNLKGLSSLPHEFRFIRKDGAPVWILEKVASIEYKGKRAAIGSFMDITELKQMEAKLRQRGKELEQRTNQLLALQKITTSIQRTLELKEVLQHVADGVVFNLGFEHALILLLDDKKGVVRGTVFSTREDFRAVEKIETLLSKRLTEMEVSQKKGYSRAVDAAAEGKVTITHDLYEMADPILTQEESVAIQKALKVKTFVNMPLFARGRHVGSILACSRHEDVKGVALEPLRILSDQAGVAIENANLYQGMSELAQRLAVIHALSKILGSSLDIRGVYKAFIDEIKRVMDFDRVSIAMVEGDKLRYFIVDEDVDTELKDGDALPLKDSATWLVIQTKQSIIEPDFDKEMKFPIDQIYYESGLRSAIRVPLFSKDEVFATFNLASRRPDAYGYREKEILEQIAGPLTAAIENSRLFNRVKGHEAELVKAYAELKKAQGFMVQSEKLRALGEMAGGVAHDFNNILAVVLGRTQLALEDVQDPKLKKDLQIIEQTALDAAKTVRRLQDFARVRVERNFELLDLKEVIESALQMVESRRSKSKEREGVDIEIESNLKDVAPIEGDASELREGLLNIIFNAMDAMPAGGKITVETKHDKKWVTISISDTGAGMTEAVKSKLFEPFFTTKKHKGTGLGLSVTYGIIKRHRGEISFKSKVGAGTTFYIKLPASSGEVKKGTVGEDAAGVASAAILMVDDNPEVAGVLGLTLKRLGHKVTEANSGEAAVNTFEIGKFDMVITDLGMPDMSGYEVAKIVKEIKPGTPVLVISGWGGQLNLADMPEVDGVIAKPFSKDVLSKKISELLSKKAPEPKAAAPDAAGDEKGGAVVPVAGDDKHVSKEDSKVWKAGKGAHGKKGTKAAGGSHVKKTEKPTKNVKPKGGKKGK